MNSFPSYSGPVSSADSVAAEFAGKVYGWLAAGLLASAVTAYQVSHNASLLNSAGTHIELWLILPFVPLLALSFAGQRVPAVVAIALYLGFCFIEGMSLGVIVSYYTTASVTLALVTTGGLFAAMAFVGTVVKRDLTSLGGFLFVALIGLIVASLANLFFASTTLMWAITYLGIAIFLGFSAYDAQRVKRIALSGGASTNMAVMCAVKLYLDILNLFLFLLRIFGRQR